MAGVLTMSHFVLGERRREPRLVAEHLPVGFLLTVPGSRSLELVDASPSGARLRTHVALKPGRAVSLRRRSGDRQAEHQVTAMVLRCWVHRLHRTGVTFEVAVRFQVPGGP